MYYEHRNYLPSIGALLAVAGLFALAPARAADSDRPNRLILAATIGLVAVLAFATLGRALVWRHFDTIVEQALRFHPNSMRAHLDLATLALLGRRYDESERILGRLATSANPRDRLLANVNLITTQCLRDDTADATLLKRIEKDAQPELTIFESQSLLQLTNIAGKGCGAVSLLDIAQTTDALIAAAHAQPDSVRSKWVARAIAAQLYARADHWPQAQVQAELAWQPAADLAIGEMLTRIYVHNGRLLEAERTYAQLSQRTKPYDTPGQHNLRELRKLLDSERSPSNSPS